MPLTDMLVPVCNRCGHVWLPNGWKLAGNTLPKCCARCKSPYWNIPKRDSTQSDSPQLKHSTSPTNNVVEAPSAIQSVSKDRSLIKDLASLPADQKQSNQKMPLAEKKKKEGIARGSSADNEIARKNGHKLGCVCYVCERLRRLLTASTGKQSAMEKPKLYQK